MVNEKALQDTPPLVLERLEDGTCVGHFDGVVLQSAFQPIFRFEGERLVPIACEALLRVSRDGVPVLNDAFFSMLAPEAYRALEPNLHCLHIRNAHFLPRDMRRLFLNFDPGNLDDPAGFEVCLHQLGAELRAAGISPADVVCEITEAETRSKAALTHFTYELRARGYLVAIDDYGSNASRMDRVAALAPDIVKFDGPLVRRMMETSAGAASLRMLVQRFRKEGIQCVLEGLENLWQVHLAETTDASMVQGFALAAPRHAGPDLPAWLARFRPRPPEAGSTTRLVKRFR